MGNKIQIGYNSDTRGGGKKTNYGRRNSGKLVQNGGFSGMPTVTFEKISDDKWNSIFDKSFLPKWKRDLLEQGESIG